MKKKAIIIRHANSTGNFEGIIQGRKEYHLSELGRKEIVDIVNENYNTFKDIDYVISSSMIRTYETARGILILIHKDLNIEQLSYIKEVDSGIIAGKTHNEVEEKYPDYYKIWMSRKDLDGIPDAEKGEELQARCIGAAFIIGQKNFKKVLIVTHAAFMRCFINTLNHRPRCTPVKVNNLDFHIIDNIDISERFITLNNSIKNKIYTYDAVEKKYVLKCLKREDKSCNTVIKSLKKLSNKIDFIQIPIILWDDFSDNEIIKISEFKEGKVVFHKTREQHKNILKKIYLFHEILNEHLTDEQINCKNLKQKLVELSLKLPNNSKERVLAEILLADEEIIIDKKYVIWDDCHANNILINGDVVSFIDLESFVVSSLEYAIASYIAASIILNEYHEITKREILFYVNLIENVDSKSVLHMIVYRLATGLMYFKNKDILTEAEKQLYQKYIDSLMVVCNSFFYEDKIFNMIRDAWGE